MRGAGGAAQEGDAADAHPLVSAETRFLECLPVEPTEKTGVVTGGGEMV